MVGCGKDSSKKEVNSSETVEDETEIISQWIPVVIQVPSSPEILDASRSIKYKNKIYFIGSQTPQNIEDYIHSLKPGEFDREIKGVISKEIGHYPNPSAESDVIHIEEIR